MTLVSATPKTNNEPAPLRKAGQPTGEEQRIAEMLSYRRAHDSEGEAEFIKRFILPLRPTALCDEDSVVHALHLRIPNADGSPSDRAFCAHTDSVHNRQITTARQAVGFDTLRREFFVSDEKQRDCLGADDAAGCYVLIRLIEAGVPGMYVFFRGEERGGIGSSFTVSQAPELFEGVKHAIQFDRRGTSSIITEMMRGRTCSDQFAKALGAALCIGHKIDPTGSFTDTANLAEIVPECTNVSVGYEHEHSAQETLDARYLLALVDHCIDAFSDSGLQLPVERMPGEYEDARSFRGYGSYERDWWVDDNPRAGVSCDVSTLAEMTRKEIHAMAVDMTFNELVDLLYEAGDALYDAYVHMH